MLQRQAGLKPDYFTTYNWTEDWNMGGQTVPMSFWNRPLHAMTDAFTVAGFRISVISEPDPAPEARELFPDEPRPAALPVLLILRPARRITAASRRSSWSAGTRASSPTSPPVPSRTGPNPDQASAGEAYCLVRGRVIHINSVCLALGRDRPVLSVSQIFHVGGHALKW